MAAAVDKTEWVDQENDERVRDKRGKIFSQKRITHGKSAIGNLSGEGGSDGGGRRLLILIEEQVKI